MLLAVQRNPGSGVLVAEARVIKKYTNCRSMTPRRAATSRSRTRKLIVGGEKIKVVDDKSGEDLTRQILLQTSPSRSSSHTGANHRGSRGHRASTAILQQVTRAIEQSLGGIMQQQRVMQDEMTRALKTPMAPLAELARQNMELWAQMQASMLSSVTPAPSASPTEPGEAGKRRKR